MSECVEILKFIAHLKPMIGVFGFRIAEWADGTSTSAASSMFRAAALQLHRARAVPGPLLPAALAPAPTKAIESVKSLVV